MSRQLPRGWDERVDEKSGRTYYVNHETRQTSWTLPSEQPLPPGWEQQYDGKGRVFFINHEKEITTWTDPRNAPQQQQPHQQQQQQHQQQQQQQQHHQQQQQQQQQFNRHASHGKILKPGTLIKVHKSAVEAIAAMVLGYDGGQGTHSIALENGRTDDINLGAVSHETIEDLMERIARFFVICEQAHRAFPPNSQAIELSLLSIATTLKDWMAIYTSTDAMHNSIDKQAQLGQILSYFMDQRAALVLTQAMELGGALGDEAIQCLAEINNVLRLADPGSVSRVSQALQEAGVTRGLVYLLRGGSVELVVKILHVVSFYSGDVDMVRSFEAAGGVVLLCELLVNAPIQQHAVTVLQQMLAVDHDHLVQVIWDSGGVQYLYLVLESSIGHVQKQALLVLQQLFANSSTADISSSGIIPPLIAIISKGGEATAQAVEMLVPMARTSQTAAQLVDAGTVTAMIAMCQGANASDTLRMQVFELLHGIASTNNRCVQQLAQSAAPALLLDVVGRSITGAAVGNHALTTAALLLLADLCDNERVCSTVRSSGGVEVLISCLQSAVPPACKESTVEILSAICQADPSVADVVASSGAAEAAIALLTGTSDKAKAFIASLLNRGDVLRSTMSTLRTNEPLLTLMVKNFVTQLRQDPSNHEPVFSLQTFCSLPDDGHVMLQMRRLQIANAAGAIPALIKLIRDAGPLPMKMAAMSAIAELAKDPTTCSVLEQSHAFAVICTGLTSWELPQLQEVALTILQYMFSGGLTLKTTQEAQTLAEALASCVVKDHAQVRSLALGLCEPLCAIEQYRVAIGHVIAPSLAALFDAGGAGQMLPPDLRNSTIATLSALATDKHTVEALIEAGSIKSIARILTGTLEEEVLVSVLDILVHVAGNGNKGCAAFLESHENDLMKFVELLPPTPLQSEAVTSRALRLLTILSQQSDNKIQQIMSIDGFLDKMLSSCQNEAYPEYRTALLSIAQSKPDEAKLVWEGVQRRVDVTAALVLLESPSVAVKTQAINALAAACKMRPEHAVARIVESGQIQAITSQLQSTNQALQQATMTVVRACALDSGEVRDVLVQQRNLQVMVRLLLSYSTPVVASAISVLRELAMRASDDFWPEVLRTANRKLVIDCLAGLFARQSLDPEHRVEVSQLLAELLGRIDVLSEAERSVVSHTLHSTLTILKETEGGSAASAQLSTLNQLLQKVPTCKTQLLRYPWLLPKLVRAAGADANGDEREVGTQLLQAYVDSESVKNDSIQLLVNGGGLADLHALLVQVAGSTQQHEGASEPALVLPVRLVAEVALGPKDVRTQLFNSDVRQWLIESVHSSLTALTDGNKARNTDAELETARAIFGACVEALNGLAAVGALRQELASDERMVGILQAVLAVDTSASTASSSASTSSSSSSSSTDGALGGNVDSVDDKKVLEPSFRPGFLAALPTLLTITRFLAPFLAGEDREAVAELLVSVSLPSLVGPVLKAGVNATGNEDAMARLCASLDTLVFFASTGDSNGSAAMLGNEGQLLVSLLQLVATQPVAKASLTALKLLRLSLFLDPAFGEEVLARGGVDRLGSALAKAKRVPDGQGTATMEEVLRTLQRLCTLSTAVAYFNSGKSAAVYGIVRSLANAKAGPGTAQESLATTATTIVELIGMDVRSRTEQRQAEQRKAAAAPPPVVASSEQKAVNEPPPPTYAGSTAPPTARVATPGRASLSMRSPAPALAAPKSSVQVAPPSYAPPAKAVLKSPLMGSAPQPSIAPRTSFLKPNQPLAAASTPAPVSSSTPSNGGTSPRVSVTETVQVPALEIAGADTPPPAASDNSGSSSTSNSNSNSNSRSRSNNNNNNTSSDSGRTDSEPALPKPYQAPSGGGNTSGGSTLGPPTYEPPPSFSYSGAGAGPAPGTGLPTPAGAYGNNAPAPYQAPQFYQEPGTQPQPEATYNDYGPSPANDAASFTYEATTTPGDAASYSGNTNNVEEGDSEDMQRLLALGFDRDQCAIALAQADMKVDEAAALLFGEELVPENNGSAAAAPAPEDEDGPLEVATFDEGVRMNGLLMKRSQHLKQWRQRFLVLKGNTLYSFKNKGEYDISAADGRSDIHNVYKILSGTTVGEANEKENMFQVKLALDPAAAAAEPAGGGAAKQPKSKETELFLAASTANLRDRWMAAIRKVVTDTDKVTESKEAVEMRDKVQQLKGMGYSRDACLAALTQSNGDVNAALDLLLAQGVDTSSSSTSGSSSAANRASSSAVETKEDEMYPNMESRIATIRLPADARPGQQIEVAAPDGSRYRIVVPEGKSGGDEIKMRY